MSNCVTGQNGSAGFSPARIAPWILVLAAALLPATVSTAAASPAIGPDEALVRHFAADSEGGVWQAASVEVEASIPKLAKSGRLRAIRRLLPPGKPHYEVLAMDGDRTVRQQVIARYLSADAGAGSMAPDSVAITSANYRFRYAGSADDGGTPAYVFDITPRKKRTGLLRGRIWIDPETGLTLRLTGRLVKNPSVFVRRIDIRRDTCVRDGEAYERITHIEIETRMVGRAELTVTERPYSPAAGEEKGANGPTRTVE